MPSRNPRESGPDTACSQDEQSCGANSSSSSPPSRETPPAARPSVTDIVLYQIAHCLVVCIWALPLRWVARLGGWAGRIVGRLDFRHRGVARRNLEQALGTELTGRAIERLVSENFGRIGESYACAVRTAGMSYQEIQSILEVAGAEKMLPNPEVQPPPSRVVAIGHFGNFELFASAFRSFTGYRFATTYRALPQRALNRMMYKLRQRSGCEFFERRLEGAALRSAMNRGGMLLGLLADQHAGRSGVWGPFFGRECSTTPAPAVLALRYDCPLFTAVCYRVGLARWRIEVGDEIPTRLQGRRRSVADITADINQAFERAIRRDLANWFWVHDRWKPRRPDRDRRSVGSNRPTARPEPAPYGRT